MKFELLETNQFRFYRAKVVDNKDPKSMGRVKVWIPDLMSEIKDEDGLWARPANCPFGAGHKDIKDGRRYAGSSFIPPKDHWVWVFFENDNPNRPYYVSGLYLENQPILPENTVGKQPWNKWVLLRSPKGRSVVISDDPSDARVVITGRKQCHYNNPQTAVYKIKHNQTVFVIDEAGNQKTRPNKDKVHITDYRGNFLRIHTYQNKVFIHATSEHQPGEVYVYTDKAMIKIFDKGLSKIQITNPGGTINLDGNGVINIDAKQTVYINAGESIILNAPQIHKNCGDGQLAQADEIPKIEVG